MRDYYRVKNFKVDQFDVFVDWTYEDSSVRDLFDSEVSDIVDDMVRRCNDGTDTHYIARVRAMYDGVELGCATLGSCYARDCSPEDDINAGVSGYLEQMVEEALDDAREEAVAMLQRLKEDFLS